jgi:hypothetical protein
MCDYRGSLREVFLNASARQRQTSSLSAPLGLFDEIEHMLAKHFTRPPVASSKGEIPDAIADI